MIEVEIRGKLTDEEYNRLRDFLALNGKLKQKRNREMFLLYDYAGYDADPTKREVDIRLRSTDGFCEIMMKTKVSEGNTARKEVSLALKDNDLEKAKDIVRAFGCKTGLHMIRESELFDYNGIEWNLVNCPPLNQSASDASGSGQAKNYKYFEAEKEAKEGEDIPSIKTALIQAAQALGLRVLNDDEMREFIYWLDREVNKEVEL